MTGGLAALGGWVTVTVNLDGSVRWQGHMHDSAADGYDFGISALVRTPSGRAIALAHTGHVGGAFTSGSRDHDWNDIHPSTPLIPNFLSDYVGGVLWMAGPGNTLLAIVAEGIASLGNRPRELTPEQYDWANNEVFLGSLPPRDRLVLTDTIGGGNRAFTFPRYDGKITLNMGEAAFNDPRNYPSGLYGQTFVHELVHACQIQHTSMDITLLADAFASKVCEATGGYLYTYEAAGPAYSDFNLEQQARRSSVTGSQAQFHLAAIRQVPQKTLIAPTSGISMRTSAPGTSDKSHRFWEEEGDQTFPFIQ